MNKEDLINQIASHAGISKAAAEKSLNAILGGITDELRRGGKVVFVGFGTFSVSERAARKGRNPQTGEVIKIAATKRVRFSAGSALKAAINKKKK